jgi:hypothetical protein
VIKWDLAMRKLKGPPCGSSAVQVGAHHLFHGARIYGIDMVVALVSGGEVAVVVIEVAMG